MKDVRALVRWEVRYNFALMEQLRYAEHNGDKMVVLFRDSHDTNLSSPPYYCSTVLQLLLLQACKEMFSLSIQNLSTRSLEASLMAWEES